MVSGKSLVRKGIGRLASLDAPSYEDNEITFSDLQKRIENTIHFLETITEEQMQGSESKEINFSIRDNQYDFSI